MMIHTKNGKKYFDRKFIQKLKLHCKNDEVRSLIAKNVISKKLVDCYGKTLLYHSVTASNDEMVEYLIARGFKVDALDANRDTPLALAIGLKDQRIMQILLAAKADPFIRNKHGKSPLHIGLSNHTLSNMGMATMLVEALEKKYSGKVQEMAKVLLEISNPFPRAMLLKNTTLTKYMLEKGCSVRDQDCQKDTALHYAVECMDVENVKLLLQLGADVYATDWDGQTPIHLYKFGKEENYEILHCLLNNGALLDLRDDHGNSLANQMLLRRKSEHVKVILDYGVDLHEANVEYTLLHYMTRNENLGVMELLEGRTFDVDARDQGGRTALCTAAESANYNAVEFLLRKGADSNSVDDYQDTVLYYSLYMKNYAFLSRDTEANYSKCLELLLEYGAELQGDFFEDDCHINFLRPAIAQVAMKKTLNQRFDGNVFTEIQSHKMFRKYFNVCQRKMEKIKSTVVCDKVRLSAFFVEPEKKLLIYARNQESRARLERFLRRESRSPLFCVKLLRKRIRSIVQLAKLREQAALSICEISGCYNREVIDRIILFLDIQTMENVVKV